jgi:glucokinase
MIQLNQDLKRGDQSADGRLGEQLVFRGEPGYVAGVDIGGTHLRMLLADLNGDPVARWKISLPSNGKDPKSVCALIREGLQALCRDAGAKISSVLHLTAGAPGITDAYQGVVRSAPNLTGWLDVNLGELLHQALRIDVKIENDTNLAALGEHWRGAARHTDNFVFIAMGTGIGAGIFLRGQLYHGAAWTAGEIGYLRVSGLPNEPLQLAETGQLERAIGGEGIEADWRARLRSAGHSEGELRTLRASQIFDGATEGDIEAHAVLDRVATILADALTTLTLLINPDLVVIGGGVGSHPALCESVDRLLRQTDFPHPKIYRSALDTEAQLYGAISLSLSEVARRSLQD